MAAFARWRPRGPAARRARCSRAVWLLAELARGVIFTGFPWVASGYAHVDAPLGGLAPWIGVYGIGAVAAGLAAAFGFSRPAAARGRGWRRARPCWRALVARRACRQRRLHPAGRRRCASRCCRATCRRTRSSSARFVPQALELASRRSSRRRAAISSSAPRPWFRCCRASSTRTAGKPCSTAFAQPGRAAHHRPAARQRRRRLHQFGGRHLGRRPRRCPAASTATTSTTSCRSASSSRPGSTGSRG